MNPAREKFQHDPAKAGIPFLVNAGGAWIITPCEPLLLRGFRR
jgi:hypothetical protein